MRAAVEGEYDLADLTEGSPIPYAQMARRPRRAGRRRSSAPTCASCCALLGATPDRARYHEAPAAKYYHQAYRHGLLEHCLSVAQGVSALAATFPGSTATSR